MQNFPTDRRDSTMCFILMTSMARCRCTAYIPDGTTIQICEKAIRNAGKPCQILSFPPPEKTTDPVCSRCSQSSGITIVTQSAAVRRAISSQHEVRGCNDEQTQLRAELAQTFDASGIPSVFYSASDDHALVRALQDATNRVLVKQHNAASDDPPGFVVVCHEDAQEHFDSEGAPASAKSPEDATDSAHMSAATSLVGFASEFMYAFGRLISS